MEGVKPALGNDDDIGGDTRVDECSPVWVKTDAQGNREGKEMSKQELVKVVQRSINDAAFRRQLTTDADSALRGYTLTPDEIGALRSRDAGKLTAFGVDTRMSKMFTIEQGALGTPTITSEGGALRDSYVVTGEPRDVAPMWIGDGGTKVIQTPDAAERNAAIISDPLATGSGVQSPDAVDRNLAYTTGGSEPRDSEPVWIGDTAAATHAAPIDGSAEESFNSLTASGSEPRDVAPTWIGDNDGTMPAHTYSGDDNAGPENVSTGDGDLQQ